MHVSPTSIVLWSLVACAVVTPVSALAQQSTGVPGSPNATTAVDGRLLPNPPAPFGGVITMRAQDAKPYWPPQIVPPKGTPNVLLIMTDDQGYGVTGTFGGVMPTLTMDRIAQAGLRDTQCHSTALCSPLRAAPADAGMAREGQGQVRHGLERSARADLGQPEAARRDLTGREAHALVS